MSSCKCIYLIIISINANVALINICFNKKRSHLSNLNFETFEFFNIAIKLKINNNFQLNQISKSFLFTINIYYKNDHLASQLFDRYDKIFFIINNVTLEFFFI